MAGKEGLDLLNDSSSINSARNMAIAASEYSMEYNIASKLDLNNYNGCKEKHIARHFEQWQ